MKLQGTVHIVIRNADGSIAEEFDAPLQFVEGQPVCTGRQAGRADIEEKANGIRAV